MNFLEILKQEVKIHFVRPEVEEKITTLIREGNPVLVGVCGESACGKTTLLSRLKERLPTATFISTDNYYKDMREPLKKYGSFSKMVEAGYPTESAEAFQTDLLRQDLDNLKKGRVVQGCTYDMRTGESKPAQLIYKPSPIVFAEGICTLCDEVRDRFDIKIYLTVDREVQKERYFSRSSERGHSLKDMEEQFTRVSEAAEKYIRINQKYADLIAEVYTREDGIRKLDHQIQKNKLDKEKERI